MDILVIATTHSTIAGTIHTTTTAGTTHGIHGTTTGMIHGTTHGMVHGTALGTAHGTVLVTHTVGDIADLGAMEDTMVVTTATIATGMATGTAGIVTDTQGATTILMVEAVEVTTTAQWQIANMGVHWALELKPV